MRRRGLKWRALCALLAVSFCLCCGVLPARAEEKRTVRVGYVNTYGISTEPGSSQRSGYCYDFLMEIASQAGWQLEFVRVEWSEGLEKLASGEIDLFGPIQKDQERTREYDFPDREMGFEYGALYAEEENSSIYYNDVQSFHGIRVGTERNNFYNRSLREYCEENDIEVEWVYTDASRYQNELETGKLDAVLAGSLMDLPNAKVMTKICAEPFYYAVTKGNQVLLDELNHALENIFLKNAYFAAELDHRYYGDQSINTPAFTRAEAEFINANPVLRVACDPAWTPIEYYDEKARDYKGINIDVLNQLGKICGIEFEYVHAASYEESKDMLARGEADLLLGYTQQSERGALGVRYTDPFLEIPVMMVGRKTIDPGKKLSVAMRKLDSALSQEIMKAYPHFSYTGYEKSSQVMTALKSGNTDAIFISSYVFDEVTRTNLSESFISVPTKIVFSQCIGVSERIDPVVLGVLNKSIRRLSPEQVSAIVFSNTVNRAYTVPFSKVIKDNSLVIIVLLLLFLLLLLVISRYNQRTLEKIAYVDDLTGVATLAGFQLKLAAMMKNTAPGESMLVTLDIDDFKYINDSFSYEVGNRILISIAEHFRSHIGPDELLGRVGADNFIFFGKKLLGDQLEQRFGLLQDVKTHLEDLLPEHYAVTFSAGFYTMKDPAEDFSLMLDKANFARKSIKGDHSRLMAEYTAEMDSEIEWKKEVTLDMELALRRGEFQVYLQPKYYFSDEKLAGAEALVRWKHPEKGMLPPSEFISIFEQNGFIRKLDLYVFDRVCAMQKTWQQAGHEIAAIPVSVNLSRLHLYNPQLADELMKLVERHGVSTKGLEIELTESIVFHNTARLIEMMQQLRGKGFRISIDDFGSGYSSLNMLKDLPVDVLKIDKGFLSESADVHNGRVIIEAVTKLAKQLNLSTVAEGVETKEQAVMLTGMGCDIAQGYYYARPMPVEDFEKLI